MNCIKRKVSLNSLIGIIAAFYAVNSPGQTSADSTNNDSTIILKTIKVSATRMDIEREKLPQKIEVINKKDIGLTIANDIIDVLKKNASIDVIQYPGLLSGVGIRGFRPNYSGINQHTLTLLDGRTSGASNLAAMQTFNIEGIEIVKGPVSALYGPQAMGGVINIIPTRSTGPIKTSFKTKLGSFETTETQLTSGGSLFKFLNYDFSGSVFNQGKDYRIGSNYILESLNSDRFSGRPKKVFTSGDTVVIEDLGTGQIRHYTKYDKNDFSLRIGVDIGEHLTVDLRGELFGAYGVETPGNISGGDNGAGLKSLGRNDEEITIKGNFELNKFKATQYYSKENSDYFKGFEYKDNAYIYHSSDLIWNGIQINDNIQLPFNNYFVKPIFTIGLAYDKAENNTHSYQNEKIEIAPYSPDYGRSDLGVYTQCFIDFLDGLSTLSVGSRYDRITSEIFKSVYFPNNLANNETFNVFSPSYGLTFSPFNTTSDNIQLTLYHNIGKGFVPQDAFHLAGYNISQPDTNGRVQIEKGNPELKPEKNISIDGGIRGALKSMGLSLEFGGYYTVVTDFVEISFDSVPKGKTANYNGIPYPVASIKTYRNNDYKTKMAGLEWNLEWNILSLFKRSEKLSIICDGHAVLFSEKVTADDTSEVLNIRNPNFSICLSYDDNRRISTRLTSRFSGKQKDTDYSANYPQPDIIYPAFLITDFVLQIKLSKNQKVGAQIQNITDENYYEKRGYNLPGRSFGLEFEISL